MADRDLRARLDRWVADGLIDAAQADRIVRAEQAAPAGGPGDGPAGGVRSLVVEALGYLGGALAAVAGFIAVVQLWPDIPLAAEMAFAGAGALLLCGAGVVIPAERNAAFGRLRGVLWLLATGCAAIFMVRLTGDVVSLNRDDAMIVSAAVTAGAGIALWRHNRGALQHLAMFAAIVCTAGAVAARLQASSATWLVGLAVWAVSVAWLVLVRRRSVPPPAAGRAAAAVGMLVGAQLTMGHAAGHVLALGTVAALLTAGALLGDVTLLGFGAWGVLQMVPQTALEYLPATAAAPIAVFLVGLAVLGVAVRLARPGGRTARGDRP